MAEIKDLQVPMAERWRKRIQAANILDRLLDHFAGIADPPMDAGQIQIGLKLLNKMMPDLKAVEVKGMVTHLGLNRRELENRLRALGHDPAEVWERLERKSQQKQQVIEHAPGETDSESDDQDTQVIELQRKTASE